MVSMDTLHECSDPDLAEDWRDLDLHLQYEP